MASIGEIVVRINGENSGLNNTIRQSQGKMKSFGKKMNSVGKSVSKVGKSLTKNITMPILAVGVGLGKLASDFQKANNTIRVGTGATGKALEDLNKDFQEVFKEVPEGMDVVSSALADLNTRTGLSGKKLQKLTKQMIDLGRITNEDVTTLIEKSTRVFGDWGIAMEDSGDTMDFLFKASQSTGIGVSDLEDKLVKFGAPLRQMGFDFKTSAALLGKFEKEGVNAELVMGSLRIALSKMAQKGVKDASKGLKLLVKGIKNAGSTGEANKKAIEAFGAKAGPDMAAAIREGRLGVDDLVKSIEDSDETIKKASKATETFGDKMKKTGNKLAVSLKPFTDKLTDLADKYLPKLEKAIQPVIDALNKLSPEEAGLALVIGALIASIPVLILLMGTLITSLGTIIGLFGWWLIPIAAVIAIFVLLGLAFIKLYRENEEFRTKVNEVWNKIGEKVKEIVDKIKTWWNTNKKEIMVIAEALWVEIGKAIETGSKLVMLALGIFISLFKGDFGDAFDKVVEFAGTMFTSITGIFNRAKKTMDKLTGLNETARAIDPYIASRHYTAKTPKKKLPTTSTSKGFGRQPTTGSARFRFANGTDFAPGGISLVGERGPELVNLPRGSQVFDNSDSKDIMGSSGIVNNITITGNTITDDYAIDKIGDRLSERLKSRGVY